MNKIFKSLIKAFHSFLKINNSKYLMYICIGYSQKVYFVASGDIRIE